MQQTQQGKQSHAYSRDQQHTHTGQLPDLPVGQDGAQVAGADQHAGDQHRERGVHAAQQLQGLDDQRGQRASCQICRSARMVRRLPEPISMPVISIESGVFMPPSSCRGWTISEGKGSCSR